MEIPGYYFDKTKNRYFKITNGSAGNPYHNSDMQKHKRQQKLESRLSKTPQKPSEYKLLYKQASIHNVKLGLHRTNPTSMEFERLKAMKQAQWATYYGLECRFWDIFTVDGLIHLIATNQNRNFMVFQFGDMAKHDKEFTITQLDDGLSLNYNINELINNLNLLPYEYLTISSHENVIFCNYISESDLDNPQIYQNFVRLTVVEKYGDKLVKSDRMTQLYSFVHNLSDGEIKKDLHHLFGMNLVQFTNNQFSFHVTPLKNFKRLFITFSKFIDNYFILGTNSGIVYLIRFQYHDRTIQFFPDVIKYKFDRAIKLDKINQVHKIDDFLFISSYKKMIVLNINTSEKFNYQLDENIKNFDVFKVLDHFRIIVVNYKRVEIILFSKRSLHFEKLIDFEIFNDNLVNQFSLISIKNTIVVNSSYDSVLVINLNDLAFKRVRLEYSSNKINGMVRLGESYLLVSTKTAGDSSAFTIYHV